MRRGTQAGTVTGLDETGCGVRDPHDIRHGDTWEVRDGRAVVVGSNDWPPPQWPPWSFQPAIGPSFAFYRPVTSDWASQYPQTGRREHRT